MQTWPRLVATIVIWIAFSIVTTSNATANSGNSTGIIAIVAAAALFSTIAIWATANPSGAGERHDARVRTRFPHQKLKHAERSRITRLADVLDEEEAAALYEELQARLSVHSDGEVTSLDALLAEREEQNRRSDH